MLPLGYAAVDRMGKKTTEKPTPEAEAFASRVWFAYHCLPCEEKNDYERASFRELETGYRLPLAVFSKIIREYRSHHEYETIQLMARALRCDESWLKHGGPNAPTPTDVIPPRPGQPWRRCGEIPGWNESVLEALSDARQRVPPAAFIAGALFPEIRPIERITPSLAISIAGLAYEIASAKDQAAFDAAHARSNGAAGASGKMRAAPRRSR